MDSEGNIGLVTSIEEPVIMASIDAPPEDVAPMTDVAFPRTATTGEADRDTASREEPFAALLSSLGEKLGAIEQEQKSIAKGMESLQNAFDSKIKYDDSKDKIIDALHAELQSHRDDLVFKILRPVIIDLIDMHNDINSMLSYEKNAVDETMPTARLVNTLQSFQGTIVEILARNGVEAFSEPGELFAPKKQRSIRILDTDDQAKNGTVVERLRRGFIHEDRLLAHEHVVVYRYQPGSTAGQSTGDQ